MIVFKEHIDSRITDRGIFYCSITVSFGEKKKSEKIVYSRYMHEKCISPFIDKNILDSIGVKKTNLKQIVHIKLEVISFLSNVHIDTYNRWQSSQILK